jgi:hypothetical protein
VESHIASNQSIYDVVQFNEVLTGISIMLIHSATLGVLISLFANDLMAEEK